MRKLRTAISTLATWLRSADRPVQLLALAGILLAVDILAVDVHLNFAQSYLNLDLETYESPFREFLLPYFRKYYLLGLVFLLPALFAALYRSQNRSRVLIVSIASLALLLAWLPGELLVTWPAATASNFGEEPAPFAYFLKVLLILLLIASPPYLVWKYEQSSILDRYVIRSFLNPFLFCFLGFLAIWLIIDLSDNGPDFLDAKTGLGSVVHFYLVQLPQIAILIMPVTLLLAVLYSLGKMSRSNEVVSMLGIGRSLGAVLRPIFFIGLYATFLCIALNYEWAPWSEGHKDSILHQIREGYEQETATVNQLHRNNIDHRTWFIGLIPFDLRHHNMRTLEIRHQDPKGGLLTSWFAYSGSWFPHNRVWRLNKGVIYHYGEDGIPRRIEPFERIEKTDWRETPWKLISSSFKPEHLGVPQLVSYLRTNSDHPPLKLAPFRSHKHYRWALPFGCIVVILVASPLGIVHSRRGVLGGVAACIFIFFAMLFLNSFFMALAQGYRIPAILGAWTTNILFTAVGAYLLHYRARNRNVPIPTLQSLKDLWKQIPRPRHTAPPQAT